MWHELGLQEMDDASDDNMSGGQGCAQSSAYGRGGVLEILGEWVSIHPPPSHGTTKLMAESVYGGDIQSIVTDH